MTSDNQQIENNEATRYSATYLRDPATFVGNVLSQIVRAQAEPL